MSQFNIYLDEVPDYLDQWMRHDLWNPVTERVEFERGSAPHAILAAFLTKAPANAVDVADRDKLLPVEVPTFKGINPETRNYLPKRGRDLLLSSCKNIFKALLDSELGAFYSMDIQITDLVYAFMEKHGIDPTEKNWETIRQMFSRMRKKNLTFRNVK